MTARQDIKATTKVDRWRGLTSVRRMLFWLFAVLAVGETPLSFDESASLTESRSGAPYSGQLRLAVNPPNDAAGEDAIAAELASPEHLSLSALATETGENPFGVGGDLRLQAPAELVLAAEYAPTGIVQSAHLGFQSQAPPATA